MQTVIGGPIWSRLGQTLGVTLQKRERWRTSVGITRACDCVGTAIAQAFRCLIAVTICALVLVQAVTSCCELTLVAGAVRNMECG